MKYTILTKFIAWSIFLAQCIHVVTVPTYAASFPTVKQSEQLLADEVQKMLDAGHLKPAFLNEHEYFISKMRTTGVAYAGMEDYWSNPAETVYTLIRALPYLPSSMQPAVRTYIQNEWNTYKPYQYTHMGWSSGAQREIFDIPPDALDDYMNMPVATMNQTVPSNHSSWVGFKFHPFNLYVSWMYAKEFGGATTIMNSIRTKVEPLPTDAFFQSHLYALNSYIAGYIGYLNLQQLAGEQPSAQVQSWLDTALTKRVAFLDMPPEEVSGIDFGGYLWVVPELADYLRTNALSKAKQHIDTHSNFSAPYWFVANMDELERLTYTYPAFEREEGATSTYYAYSSLFQAKALILKEPRAELEKWLDVPAVERGDLYYIQNLTSVIAADTNPLTPSPTVTTPPVPGDADGNRVVNVLDYTILSNTFGSTTDLRANFNTDTVVNILDYQILANHFGRSG